MRLASILISGLTLGVALPAAAAEGDDYKVRGWAASCAACHGTNGVSAGDIPSLAGKDRDKLVTALKEFKAGTKTATVMHQHAKGYSDEQLEKLAAWFASRPRN